MRWCVPIPAHASLPLTSRVCVCQGIHFCAILNNSIFIGPTKTYHPLLAHTPPVCAPITPATGNLALSAFPIPSPPASPCSSCLQNKLGPCPCDAQPARERGTVPGWAEVGVPAGHPAGSNQRKSLAVPSSGLVAPGSGGDGGGLYFISVVCCSQSPAHPCTTRKR